MAKSIVEQYDELIADCNRLKFELESQSTEGPRTMSRMHSEPQQKEMRTCAMCPAVFAPKVPWQEFCSGKCRTDYNKLKGVSGRIIAGPRRLAKGKASITIHFTGPAAEGALNLLHGDHVYISKANRS